MRPPDVPLFLDRLTDAADYAVIGPVDGRRQVIQTRRAPYARLLLTAGHCVYSPVRRIFGLPHTPISIRVSPGRADAIEAPFGSLEASRWHAHMRYLAAGARRFDIGLVELGEDARGLTPLRLHAPTDTELARIRQVRLLHVSGYPADKPRGTQWEHEERLDRVTARDLFYSIDTCPGHSGGPLWVERWPGSHRSIIGVHTAGPRPHAEGAWGCRPGVPMAPTGHMNRGVRLTRELHDAILRIAESKASPRFIAVGGREAASYCESMHNIG
jgi:glutamyl endopeptidase